MGRCTIAAATREPSCFPSLHLYPFIYVNLYSIYKYIKINKYLLATLLITPTIRLQKHPNHPQAQTLTLTLTLTLIIQTIHRYKPGDRIAMRLGSCRENVVTQLAAAIAGYSVVTVKTGEALGAAVDTLACRGVVVDAADAMHAATSAAHHPPIVVANDAGLEVPGAVSFGELDNSTGTSLAELGAYECAQSQDHEEFAFYNASKPTSLASLIVQGESTAAELSLTADDRICLPITLNHSMGMGFGVLAALSSGASIVLPSPTPDADLTVAAVRDEDCTILFADSHTLKNLPADSVASDQPSLRGGIIKVGSGEAFGVGSPRVWAGVRLTTVGKPAAASGTHGHGHGHSHSSK